MIHIRFGHLVCLVCLITLFSSCSDRNDSTVDGSQPNGITFVTSLSQYATRLSQNGNQWTAGDQIGIYMVEAGKTTETDYSNVPYTAESSAQTTVFKAGATSVCYPADKSPVDFIAYYPYSATISNRVYPVSLADQSAGTAAHDLLYAKANNDGKGYTSGAVSFGFKHQLSKMILNLVDESGNALTPDTDGLLIRGMNTTAGFSLQTGALSDAGTAAAITPYRHDQTAEAILLPFTIGAGHQVIITVDGNQYLWTMNKMFPGLEVKAGHSYTFKITVKTSEAEVEAVLVNYDDSSIAPWEDGGADNQKPGAVEELEIPAGFEKIELPTGGSIKTALSGATTSKVAIMLANGGTYEETSGFSVPASITSLMIVGKGGTAVPTVYFGSSMTLSGNMDLIHLYNLNLNGIIGSSYFMNQSAAVNVKQVLIENCIMHDLRGIVRLQGGASTIDSYRITNSIVYNINTYNLLTVDAGSVPSVEISKSTFYNLAGRGIYLNAMAVPATVTVSECTFNLGPKYAIVQFSSAGGSLTFTGNIVGLPYDATRGVSAGSNATSTTENGNYYVSDTSWNGTPVGTDCGYTAAALFANPANGNFTQSRLTAGDPRWY